MDKKVKDVDWRKTPGLAVQILFGDYNNSNCQKRPLFYQEDITPTEHGENDSDGLQDCSSPSRIAVISVSGVGVDVVYDASPIWERVIGSHATAITLADNSAILC